MERVLGPGHHHAQITRSNLANFRGEAGDAAGAAATLTTLLADRKRIPLGADHPKTLLTCSDLIRWQAHTEDPATVTEAFTDLLEKMEQVLGPDHPTTLKTRSYLARFWDESGNTADAVSELTGLLADQERILGDRTTPTPLRPGTNSSNEEDKFSTFRGRGTSGGVHQPSRGSTPSASTGGWAWRPTSDLPLRTPEPLTKLLLAHLS